KRIAQNNEAMLRISMALPHYPDLEDLLDFLSNEIKDLVDAEGGVVILYDEERQELFFLGAAYDDTATEKRVKEVRFSLDELLAGQVIKTRKPMIVNDMSRDTDLHAERDKKLGYHTNNLLLVPFRSIDRVIGVLCAINKKGAGFEQSDVELLNTIAGTIALSIENARFSEEIKKAYREVTSMNRAKDRVINHLSHELKTPVAVLHSSLVTLAKRLNPLPEEVWKHIIERTQRNLDRILEIQYKVDDIIQDRPYKTYHLLSDLLDQCKDELEALITEEVVDGTIIERITKRIDDLFGPKEALLSEGIVLSDFVVQRIEQLRPSFLHRQVEIISCMENRSPIWIPKEVLQKVFDGLLKNALENTPDEGKIEISVLKKGERVQLVVHDYGVGITEENQRRIFEGFFTTRDTMHYSTKNPFDFNAGGKGADLLRMKIFSERYHFQLEMTSSRCGFIPKDIDICPGRISRCLFCEKREDCFHSGETTFSITFSPPP
ncbi:MAG: GAF domain-containing protein, partial [Pseudomonadota bacterium]